MKQSVSLHMDLESAFYPAVSLKYEHLKYFQILIITSRFSSIRRELGRFTEIKDGIAEEGSDI